MTVTTYMQTSFTAPKAATVRFTDGTDTADLVVSKGQFFASIDDLLSVINAAIGSTSLTLALSKTGANKGKITVSAASGTVSITWSHTGDGTAIRNVLGCVDDYSTASSPVVFGNRHTAGFYPARAARGLSRVENMEARGFGTSLTSNQYTQHSPTSDGGVKADLVVELQISCDAQDYSEVGEIDNFYTDLGSSGSVLPAFALIHDGIRYDLQMTGRVHQMSFVRRLADMDKVFSLEQRFGLLGVN